MIASIFSNIVPSRAYTGISIGILLAERADLAAVQSNGLVLTENDQRIPSLLRTVNE